MPSLETDFAGNCKTFVNFGTVFVKQLIRSSSAFLKHLRHALMHFGSFLF